MQGCVPVVSLHGLCFHQMNSSSCAGCLQAQQLDSLLKSISAAIAALKVAEQQHHQPQFQRQSEIARDTRTTSGGTNYTAGGSYRLPDTAAAAPGDLNGGLQLPFAHKLRGIWHVVGRVAGFLPPQANGAAGISDAAMRGGSMAMQGSGPRAGFSSSGGGADGMGGGGSGLGGGGYHQSRAVRIAGTASSAAAREGMRYTPSSNVRQAYPQL
jgi:hypothetical protein